MFNPFAGGGMPKGGIILLGETTTLLTDNCTTNPIVINGEDYLVKPNNAVIYENQEFLFDGTKWHEFGDISNLSSKNVKTMAEYEKAEVGGAISPSDSLNQAIGKLEKRVDINQNNIDGQQNTIADGGNGYAIINGIPFYLSHTVPTGNIPNGAIGTGW